MDNDLISRSALLEKLSTIRTIGQEHPVYFLWRYALTVASRVIKTAPAVDAVPVVRCGECEKRKTTECALSYFVFDDFDVEVRFLDVPDDFYCPHGERRTE